MNRGLNLVMKVAELASVISFLNLWWMAEVQTPFQAQGEQADVQEAKNQINHPLQMPDQYIG